MRKGGISTIVATVLIVLVTTAAVTILWAGVFPYLSQDFFLEDVNVRFQIDKSEYTQYDPDNNLLSVRVDRGSDDANIVGVRFVIEDEQGNTYSHVSYDVPNPNARAVYSFSVGEIDSVEGVSITPIYEFDGGEREGSYANSIDKVPTSVLSSMGSDFVLFGAPSGLIVYYPFTDSANDTFGIYNGTLAGGAFIVGGELVLDGDNDNVKIPTLGLDNLFDDKVTVSVWVEQNVAVGVQQIFLENKPLGLGIEDGKLFGNVSADGGWRSVVSSKVLTTGWHNVGLVYDGASMKLFIDGEFDASAPHTGDLDGNGCVLIGKYTSGGCGAGSSSFNGSIDSLMIFDKALSAEEVRQLYNFRRKG